jgi:hypothetical protein
MMSQFYLNPSVVPPPPTVATSYTTDVLDNTTSGPGTSIPASNILQLLGRETNQNNNNGIRTDADPNNGNVVYTELTNRVSGSVTTTDATVTTIISFTLPTTGNYSFDLNIAAYNTTDTLGAAYSMFVGFISVAGAATKLNLEDKIVNEQAGMTACNATATTSGNNILIQVTGIAAKTINWRAVGTYTFVGA